MGNNICSSKPKSEKHNDTRYGSTSMKQSEDKSALVQEQETTEQKMAHHKNRSKIVDDRVNEAEQKALKVIDNCFPREFRNEKLYSEQMPMLVSLILYRTHSHISYQWQCANQLDNISSW